MRFAAMMNMVNRANGRTGMGLVRLDTSSEEAQLRAIEAQAELATLNLTRIASLRKDNMIAQTELDAAEANLKEARANAVKHVHEKYGVNMLACICAIAPPPSR